MSATTIKSLAEKLIFWQAALLRARQDQFKSWVQALHCEIEIARIQRQMNRGHE